MGTEKNRAKKSGIRRKRSQNFQAKVFRPREISGLKLEKWANLGTSISHSENKTVFVKAGIPAEIVDIRIDKENSKLIWGTVVAVKTASPLRIASDCTSFPECGGCSYRHVSYEEELRIKKELLLETFVRVSRFSGTEMPQIEILSGPSEGYRNTAQIKIQRSKGKIQAGFFQENSNSLVPFPEEGCKHLPKEMNDFIRKNLEKKIPGPKDWKLRFSSGEVFEYDRSEVKIGPYLPEKLEWSIPADGFTQVNRFLLEDWMKKIRSWIPEKTGKVLEFYSGAGLISLAIASRVGSLSGFELSESSVKAAKRNSKEAGFSHLEFSALDLDSSLPKELSESGVELCILNPPRAGASPSLLDFFNRLRPKRIVYSSCNHTTLARDLKVLEGMGYELKEIVLTDFFPRTQHFEVLVRLEL
ncbi:class I SAM-dependent RNA methyltransferase [Leptospira langatensis]|uniref:Class I SAM-dependent RNA methyltransferase n=1 Tax=Leptospira langatensis TaxID=2484983 RepID=A0A5F1ZW98_9LEPT|nr:methyltransferase domain-containing protein [Leptospira langatensis]TGK03079.1 class I SAM-dependent RNA methyltransferase [Leptospira langatensis]TGL41835.1 class I SAM-dependent RNA methyltransferase [Leptospira langatensis]